MAGSPEKPTGFSVTPSGQAFRLQASVDNGGSAITKWQYRIAPFRVALAVASWTDISSTSDDLDFTTGNIGYSETWYFEVRAVNAVGNGAASDADSATTGPIPTLSVSVSVDDATPTNGDTVTFTASVGGTATGTIAYQWQLFERSAWRDVAGETGSTYDHMESGAGTVTVRCRATRQGVTRTSAQISATWSAAEVLGELPYEITLTGSASSTSVPGLGDFGSGRWSATLPAAGWAGSADTPIALRLRGSALSAPGAWINVGPPSGVGAPPAGQELTAQLENALLKIQSADGSETYWEGVLSDHDATDPYALPWSDAEITAFLGSGRTSIKLRFEESGIFVAGIGEATFRAPGAAALTRTAPTARRFAGQGSGAFQTPAAAVLTRTAPTARRIVGTGTATFQTPAAAALMRTAPTAVTFSGRGSATFRDPAAAALTHTRVAPVEVVGRGSATFQAASAATLTRTAPTAITFAGQGSAAFRAPSAATLSRIEAQRIAGRGAATFRPASAATLTRTAPTAVRFAGQGSATFQTPAAATLTRITGSREFEFDISAISGNANGLTTIGATDVTDDQRVIPSILAGDNAHLDYLQVRWHGNRADRRQIRIVFAGTNPGRFTREVERTAPLIFEGPPGTPLATWRGPDLADYWDGDNNRYVIDIGDGFQSGGGQELNAAIRALGVGGTVRFSIGKTTLFAGLGTAAFRAPDAAVLSRSEPVRFSGVGSATFQTPAAAALTRLRAGERRFAGIGAASFRAPTPAVLTRTAPTAITFAGTGSAAFRAPAAAVLSRIEARRISGRGSATFRTPIAATLTRVRAAGVEVIGRGSATFRTPAAAVLSRIAPTARRFTGVGTATFRAPPAATLSRIPARRFTGLGTATFRTPGAATLSSVPGQFFSGLGAATFRSPPAAQLDSLNPLTDDQATARARAHTRDLTRTSDLFALKITHPDVPNPICVVADNQNITIDGDEYIALAFRAVPPNFQEGETPRAVLEIDNVGRELTEWIELTGGGRGAHLTAMQVARDPRVPTLGTVVWALPALPAGVVEITNEVVQVALAYRTGRSRPGIKIRHTYEVSPGIFG